MQKNSRIKTLDLTKNPLSQQNISELLNGRMEQLILRRCGITDEVG